MRLDTTCSQFGVGLFFGTCTKGQVLGYMLVICVIKQKRVFILVRGSDLWNTSDKTCIAATFRKSY